MSQKVNRVKSGQGMYTIPVAITKHVPADARFVAELTEDGILLRYVGTTPEAEQTIELPAWVRNGAS